MSGPVTIRRACPEDATALARLAGLDSARPLRGEILLAEANGEIRAALSLSDGASIADPFHLTLEVVDLLRLRRQQMIPASSGRRPWRRRRWPAPLPAAIK